MCCSSSCGLKKGLWTLNCELNVTNKGWMIKASLGVCFRTPALSKPRQAKQKKSTATATGAQMSWYELTDSNACKNSKALELRAENTTDRHTRLEEPHTSDSSPWSDWIKPFSKPNSLHSHSRSIPASTATQCCLFSSWQPQRAAKSVAPRLRALRFHTNTALLCGRRSQGLKKWVTAKKGRPSLDNYTPLPALSECWGSNHLHTELVQLWNPTNLHLVPQGRVWVYSPHWALMVLGTWTSL